MNIASQPAANSMEEGMLSPRISPVLSSDVSIQVQSRSVTGLTFSPSPLPPERAATVSSASPPPFSAARSSPIPSSMQQSSRPLGSPTIPYSSLSSLPSPRVTLQPESRQSSRSPMPPLESVSLRSPLFLVSFGFATAAAASASSAAASGATVEQLQIGDDSVVNVRIRSTPAGPFTARHTRLRKMSDVKGSMSASSSTAAAASSSSVAAAAPSAAASSSSSHPSTSKPFSSVTFDYEDDNLIDVADAAAAGGRPQLQSCDEEDEAESDAEPGKEKTPQQREDDAYARALLKFINKKRARRKVKSTSFAAERNRAAAAAKANQ